MTEWEYHGTLPPRHHNTVFYVSNPAPNADIALTMYILFRDWWAYQLELRICNQYSVFYA